MDLIPSLNHPYQVEASGFEKADDAAHMIEWLGRGSEFRRFVTNDVERELYLQTPDAQLLAIMCNASPELKTVGTIKDADHKGVITGISITFPLMLRIKMTDATVWALEVNHNYEATNIHLANAQRELVQNFMIVRHEQQTG